MTKIPFLLVGLCIGLFNPLNAQLPDAHLLLNKVQAAVDKVNEGSYVLHDVSTTLSVGEDSSARSVTRNCYFKQFPADPLTGYKLAYFGDNGYSQIYDGHDLLSLPSWEKTLEITPANKYPNKIRDQQHNYFLFPFFKSLNRMLQAYNLDSSLTQLKVDTIETINGEPCYKIQPATIGNTAARSSSGCFYISTTTLLPMRWYIAMTNVTGQNRTTRTFDYFMTDLQQEKVPDSLFTRAALPGYSKEKEFDPAEDSHPNRLLSVGYTAPDWELPLISGGKLKLSDLKGKITVLDFWYKACTPCLEQMIGMEMLSKKFSKEKVVFVGINTKDDPVKDKLVSFLKNREISMLSVYNGNAIEKSYSVYTSPCLFVIDKDGKILYTVDGYSNGLTEEISRIISLHL